MAISSYSQVAEDLVIAYLLGTARELRYIDIGCPWPVEHSNTYLFYANDGSGLCIDANPRCGCRLRSYTSSRHLPERCDWRRRRDDDLSRVRESGFNTFSAERAQRLMAQAEQRRGRALRERIEVLLVTLDAALERVETPTRSDGRIDFISIDVEGLELDVLRGFSFEPRPRLVVCEQIRRKGKLSAVSRELETLMTDRGYWQAAYTGHDVFYLADDA